jgi:hypothetical protein
VASSLWLATAKKHVRFAWSSLLRTFATSALLAAAAAAIPIAVAIALGWRSPQFAVTLAIAVPGSAAGFLAAAYLTKHPVWHEFKGAVAHAVSMLKR